MRAPLPGLVAEQSLQAGVRCACSARASQTHGDEVEGTFPLVLVLPPRQRDEARALFARALTHAGPSGIVLACMPNDEGAKTGQADLARLAGQVNVLSKNHCRVFWTGARSTDLRLAGGMARARCTALRRRRHAAEPARACSHGIASTRPPRCLLQHLPTDLAGEGADLGAGIGLLAMEVLARCKHVQAIDLYEAEARALALARRTSPVARATPASIGTTSRRACRSNTTSS